MKNVKTIVFFITIIFSTSISLSLFFPGIYIIEFDQKATGASITVMEGIESSVDPLSLIEFADNKTMNVTSERVAHPMTYNASFSFTDELEGKGSIQGWNITSGFDSPAVINVNDGHSKVLDLKNTSLTREFNTTSLDDQSQLVIEFWVKIYDISQDGNFLTVDSVNGTLFSSFALYDTINSVVKIKIDNSTSIKTVAEREINEWFRMSIRIDKILNVIHIYIDDIGYPSLMVRSFSSIDKISLKNSSAMIDALGFSWDNNYNVGSNRFPLKQFSIKAIVVLNTNLNIFMQVDKIKIDFVGHVNDSTNLTTSLFVQAGNFLVNVTDISDHILQRDNRTTCMIIQQKHLIAQDKILIVIRIQGDSATDLHVDLVESTISVLI